MVARKDSLLMGREYRLTVYAQALEGPPGIAIQEFQTATRPWGGTCTTTPTTGVSLETLFNFKCVDWTDQRPPLLYHFRYRTPTGAYALAASGPSSYLSTFLPAGSAERNYTREIEIVITNVAGVSTKTSVEVQVSDSLR